MMGMGLSPNPVPNHNFMRPPMDQPMQDTTPLGQQAPLQREGMKQSYDIHANSKHYFPQHAEFLSNDFVHKPGTQFNTNRNAVLFKEKKEMTKDPNLANVSYKYYQLKGQASYSSSLEK